MRRVSAEKIAVAVCLSVVVILGFFYRCYRLGDTPGFDHDEALICLGARSVAEGIEYPLTGDKVYEGPFLEYLLGFWMMAGGTRLAWVRLAVVVLNLVSVLFLFRMGKNINANTAFFTVILVCSMPWSVIMSRVIYTANACLVFYIIGGWLILRNRYPSGVWDLILIGSTTGLAMHGRLSSGILLILFLFAAKPSWKSVKILIPFGISAMCLAPVIYYNIVNHLPVIDVFQGSQGHAIPFDSRFIQTYLSRIGHYFISLWHALSCQRFWIDQSLHPSGVMVILPITMIIGVAFVVHNRIGARPDRKPSEGSGVLIWFILSLLVVPLITKENRNPLEAGFYHPHYLDMAIVPGLLISAYAIARLLNLIAGSGSLRWLTVFSGMMLFVMQSMYLVSFARQEWLPRGGPGRWDRRFLEASAFIRDHVRGDHDIIAADYSFGSGFPQLKYLLPSHRVIPFLYEMHGEHEGASTPRPVEVNLVGTSSPNPFAKKIWPFMVDSGTTLSVFHYQSPGFFIDGIIAGSPSERIRLEAVESASTGWQVNPDIWLPGMSVHPRTVKIISRQDEFQEIPAVKSMLMRATPRHRADLERIDSYLSAVKIELEADLSRISVECERRPEGWSLNCRFKDRSVQGMIAGTFLVY